MTSESCSTDWLQEANAVLKDVQRHVLAIGISNLPSSKKFIYFNMTTLENKDFCVELSDEGFQVVGEKYDSREKKGKYSVFETPYSMLDSMSPAYRDSFREELFDKLSQLKRMQESEGECSDEVAGPEEKEEEKVEKGKKGKEEEEGGS